MFLNPFFQNSEFTRESGEQRNLSVGVRTRHFVALGRGARLIVSDSVEIKIDIFVADEVFFFVLVVTGAGGRLVAELVAFGVGSHLQFRAVLGQELFLTHHTQTRCRVGV